MLNTETIILHARKLMLLSDEYSVLQDMLANTDNVDERWLAHQVSDLRVNMMRMSQSLQGVALDRTRDDLKQLELDYATGVGESLDYPDPSETLKQIGMVAKLTRE